MMGQDSARSAQPREGLRLRHFDWLLFGVLLCLLAIGVANVASTAYSARTGEYSGIVYRQICWVALGLGVFFLVQLAPYRKLEQWAYVLYGLGIVLLAVVFLMPATKGAQRWIPLGVINLQTSEPMKLFLIIALANYLKHREMKRFSELLPAIALVALPLLMIAKQPDFGTAVTLLPVAGVLVFAAGARVKHLLLILILGVNSIPLVYLCLKPYQKERVRTFLLRDQLTKQQKMDQAYQSIQAEIAVGSGGVFGKGWRKGTQNRYRFVPDRHNDFIFSILAEEWGFAGGVVLLLLYGFLILTCLGIAEAARDPFGKLLAVGMVGLLATQLLTHVAINVQLFPVTGLTLPFVSYGGTSMLTCMIAIGLVMNVRIWRYQ